MVAAVALHVVSEQTMTSASRLQFTTFLPIGLKKRREITFMSFNNSLSLMAG